MSCYRVSRRLPGTDIFPGGKTPTRHRVALSTFLYTERACQTRNARLVSRLREEIKPSTRRCPITAQSCSWFSPGREGARGQRRTADRAARLSKRFGGLVSGDEVGWCGSDIDLVVNFSAPAGLVATFVCFAPVCVDGVRPLCGTRVSSISVSRSHKAHITQRFCDRRLCDALMCA